MKIKRAQRLASLYIKQSMLEYDLKWLLFPPGKTRQIGPEKGSSKAHGTALFISPHGSYRYVHYVGGIPVAGLQVMKNPGTEMAHVANVWTAPENRREGYAALLWKRAKIDFPGLSHSGDLSISGKLWSQKLAAAAYLYHVTFIRNLPGIQRKGLVPGHGQSGYGGFYESHSTGYSFLSTFREVDTWIEKAEQQAGHLTDHPEKGWTPVVLRISLGGIRLRKDEEAEQSYKTPMSIPVDRIEIWAPNNWVPLKRVDPDKLNQNALKHAEVEDGDYYLDYTIYQPSHP